MKSVTAGVGILIATGCTTITVARVDRCVVQQSKTWGGSARSEIVFCDREQPHWSEDRTLRLTQECLYEADLHRRDMLIQSARGGHAAAPLISDDDAFAHCYPDTVKAIQGENDALKQRLGFEEDTRTKLDGQRDKFETELNTQRDKLQSQLSDQRTALESQIDSQRQRLDTQLDTAQTRLDKERTQLVSQMEGQHERLETALVAEHGQLDKALAKEASKMQDTLAKALDRPVNAVAEARSTSDSGADTAVKHNSDSKELAHFDYASTSPSTQVTDVVHRAHHNTAAIAPTKVCVTPPAPTPTSVKGAN